MLVGVEMILIHMKKEAPQNETSLRIPVLLNAETQVHACLSLGAWRVRVIITN